MHNLNPVHKHFFALLLLILGFGSALVMAPSLFGHNALSVGLSRFEAIPEQNGMRLEWDVETEIGTAGYTIQRGEDGAFDYLIDPQTNDELFILAEGSPTQAFGYSYTDESAIRGTNYTYKLFEITSGSSEQLLDEVTIVFQVKATNTPVTFSGTSGNSQDNNNPTSIPTGTQTVAAAASATSTVPAQATSTPASTTAAASMLPNNTGASNAVVENNQAVEQPAAAALSQDAYPGDSTVPPEQPENDNGGEPANEIDSSRPALADPGGVESPEMDPTANAFPGAINALEATNEDQSQMSGLKPTPIVIRGASPAAQDNPYPSQPQGQVESQQSANVDSSRILLWLAFIVALIILVASIVGAILLYSNRRSV
jgi:hypothetical protein